MDFKLDLITCNFSRGPFDLLMRVMPHHTPLHTLLANPLHNLYTQHSKVVTLHTHTHTHIYIYIALLEVS